MAHGWGQCYCFPSPLETFRRVSTILVMYVVPKSEGIISAFLSFTLHYPLKQKPSEKKRV